MLACMAAKKKLVTVTVDVAAIGSLGGKARARNLSAKRKKEIAQAAARARWAKKD